MAFLPNAFNIMRIGLDYNVPSILRRSMVEVTSWNFDETLEDEDIPMSRRIMLFKARDELGKRVIESFRKVPFDFESCPSTLTGKDLCSSKNTGRRLLKYRRKLAALDVEKEYFCDPLCGLQGLYDADWDKEGFYAECVSLARTAWRKEQRDIWAKLDEWFELNKDDEAHGDEEDGNDEGQDDAETVA